MADWLMLTRATAIANIDYAHDGVRSMWPTDCATHANVSDHCDRWWDTLLLRTNIRSSAVDCHTFRRLRLSHAQAWGAETKHIVGTDWYYNQKNSRLLTVLTCRQVGG